MRGGGPGRRGGLRCTRRAGRNLDHRYQLAEAGLLASEGTIYPLLSRLRKEELVESSWRESPSGPPRRYYSITAQGEHALADFRTVWTGFRNSVDVILSGKDPR